MVNLCKCNNCSNVLVDNNPQVNSPLFEWPFGVDELVLKDNSGWVCPNCNEDGYIVDIPNDRTLAKILYNKQHGIDCTEEESGYIKGYLREFVDVGEQIVISEIQKLFPIEYMECID